MRFLLLLSIFLFPQFQTEHLRVNLYKLHQDRFLQLVLELIPKDEHYLYWWNPGDSGESIKFFVNFDRNPVNTYPILLSPPSELKKEIITNYILKEQSIAVLSFDFLEIPKKGSIELDYLICSDICIPETLSFEFNINSLPKFNNLHQITSLDFPASLPDSISILTDGEKIEIKSLNGPVKFFPFDLPPSAVEYTPDGTVVIRAKNPNGLIYLDDIKQFYKFGDLSIFPKIANLQNSLIPFIWSMIMAILAGLILNFMPCVVPVLVLKSLKSGSSLMYIVGSTTTITLLGLLTSGVFEGAKYLGWGFQLQDKNFVFWINFLLFALTLNFLKILNLPIFVNLFPDQRSSGFFDFFFGVGVSLLALPCGAPFLVTILSTSAERTLAQNLVVFFLMGVSFSSFFPITTRLGVFSKIANFVKAYMEVVIKVLSIPLALTVFWLLWVLENQGVSPSLALTSYLLLGVGLNFLLNRQILLAIFFISIGVFFSHSSLSSQERVNQSELGVVWEAYSEQYLEQLKKQHVPYYLDFTAEWCVTCKLNKYLVFSDSKLVDDLKKANFKFIRADWTDGNKDVTKGLAKRGSKSVPLTVIFKPGKGETILPVILTPAVVRRVVFEN